MDGSYISQPPTGRGQEGSPPNTLLPAGHGPHNRRKGGQSGGEGAGLAGWGLLLGGPRSRTSGGSTTGPGAVPALQPSLCYPAKPGGSGQCSQQVTAGPVLRAMPLQSPRALAHPVRPHPTLWMLQSSILQFSCNVYKSLFPFPGARCKHAGLALGGLRNCGFGGQFQQCAPGPRLSGTASESAPRGDWQFMERLLSYLVPAVGRHSVLLA